MSSINRGPSRHAPWDDPWQRPYEYTRRVDGLRVDIPNPGIPRPPCPLGSACQDPKCQAWVREQAGRLSLCEPDATGRLSVSESGRLSVAS